MYTLQQVKSHQKLGCISLITTKVTTDIISMSVKSILVCYLRLLGAVVTALVPLTGRVMAAGMSQFGVRVALQ